MVPGSNGQAGERLGCVIYAPQQLFRELLASVLMIRSTVNVLAQVSHLDELREACGEHTCNLMLLDLAVESPEGRRAIEVYLSSNPHGRILAFVDKEAAEASPGGGDGERVETVSRDGPLRDMWLAIDRLHGRRPTRSAPATGLRRRLGGYPLSPRESEIFAFIGDGLTTKQIAEHLGLSEHTIRTHRKRLAAKLGTEGAELTRWAIVSRHEASPGWEAASSRTSQRW